MLTVAATIWVSWLAGGTLLEQYKRRHFRHIPHRVLVGGMRGKTSFVRLLHTALRRKGIRPLARTSGDSPVILLPDGSQRPFPRRGLPNISELQRLLLSRSIRDVDALVFENMAIRPDLQRTVREAIVRPTLQVMVNDAPDHLDVFPADPERRALMLLGTLDRQTPLLLTPGEDNDPMRELARGQGFNLVEPRGAALPEDLYDHSKNLVRGVLTVLEHMGHGGEEALEALAPLARDLQRVSVYTTDEGFHLADLLSVNDPASTFHLLSLLAERAGIDPGGSGVVYCHREDRPARLLSFMPVLKAHPAVIVGDRPPRTLLRRSGAIYTRDFGEGILPGTGFAFAIGNTRHGRTSFRDLFERLGAHARW